jgi:hypothetical protein
MARQRPPSPATDPFLDLARHQLRRLGVATPLELRREAERALRDNAASPREPLVVAGTWGDGSGTAERSVLAALVALGLVDDRTEQYHATTDPTRFAVAGATAPGLAFGAGAGSSPTLTSITGNDSLMRVNCTSGTGAAAGLFATVTFAVARASANYYPDVIPLDGDVPPRQFWCSGQTTTTFEIRWNVAASSTGMLFAVVVPERV